MMKIKGRQDDGDDSDTGRLIALAYPDRIAGRRSGDAPRFVLANGRGAVLDPAESLAGEAYLAVASLSGGGRDSRIFLAAPVFKGDVETDFADHLTIEETVAWDDRAGAVAARRRTLLDSLVLDDKPLKSVAPDAMACALIDGIRHMGLACLPWTAEIDTWRARVMFLRRIDGDTWPDVSDEALINTLDDWLAPYLATASRREHLSKIDLAGALAAMLDWTAANRLERLAPTHLGVPSGSRYRLDYESGDEPVLAVKLQEMFGCTETPTIADGRISVRLHLLSPAGRPLQVTQDLAAFWTNGYAQVKSEMRGRYPKHPWPDDPLSASPTRKTKRKQASD